jgi:adenosylcobinamide-GDP ribazoletransferase
VAFWFKNASKTGLGQFAGKPTLNSIVTPLVIITLISLLLMPILKLIIIIILCVLTAIVIGKLSKQQIGGYTGDILGATQVVSEVVILIYLATY